MAKVVVVSEPQPRDEPLAVVASGNWFVVPASASSRALPPPQIGLHRCVRAEASAALPAPRVTDSRSVFLSEPTAALLTPPATSPEFITITPPLLECTASCDALCQPYRSVSPLSDVLFDPNRASCSPACNSASSPVFSVAACNVNEAPEASRSSGHDKDTLNGTGLNTHHHGQLDCGSSTTTQHPFSYGNSDGSYGNYASLSHYPSSASYSPPSLTSSASPTSSDIPTTTTTKYYLVKTTRTRSAARASDKAPSGTAPTSAPLLTPASTPPNRHASASPLSSPLSSADGATSTSATAGLAEDWQCWIDQLVGEVHAEMKAEETHHDPPTPAHSERSGSQGPSSLVATAAKRSRSSSITDSAGSDSCSSVSSPPSTKRAKKYSLAALSQEEVAQRKKEQNRVAAQRYRSRKTNTLEGDKAEIGQLEEHNARMRAEIEALTGEITATKALLMADYLRVGGGHKNAP